MGVSFVWGWFTWSMWKRTIIGLWHGEARLRHKLTTFDYSWWRGFECFYLNTLEQLVYSNTEIYYCNSTWKETVSTYKNLALTFSYTKHIWSHDLKIYTPCFLWLKNSVLVERSLIFCLPSWLDSPSYNVDSSALCLEITAISDNKDVM